MIDAVVSVLTPPGTGAIATIEVRGPHAWELARKLFTPAGKPLPEGPEVTGFWFGALGADEVVLAVTAPDAVEVHCHGGRRVVRWVVEQFLANGCIEKRIPGSESEGDELLQRAPTLRTASILLDQLNGAFANEVQRILALIETDPLSAQEAVSRLAELGNTVGRHLVEPWKVAVAGPPNVGKSSLVNALAGYQRAVVSDVAGTTRDAVSVRTAFDGWPFELIDTAGLREAEGLEAEGIERAKRVFNEANLVVWVLDGTESELEWPAAGRLHIVINKSDAMPNRETIARTFPLVSAITGEGVPALVNELVARLVPRPPATGAPVPFTPQLTDLMNRATERATVHEWRSVAALLRASLARAV